MRLFSLLLILVFSSLIRFTDIFEPKVVYYSGNSLLSNGILQKILPEKNNFWWSFSQRIIERGLAEHPLIQEAEVKKCVWHLFNCYKINILEEQPKFIFNNWLVSDGGKLLLPVRDNNFIKVLPVLSDEQSFDNNQEYLQARLKYLTDTVTQIQSMLSLPIVRATLMLNNNLRIEFAEDKAKGYIFSDFQQRGFNRLAQEVRWFQGIQSESQNVDLDSKIIDFTNDNQVVFRKQL